MSSQSSGIDSLRFFTGDGRAIAVRQIRSISWRILPGDRAFPAFLKNPSGHAELSQSFSGTASPGDKAPLLPAHTYSFRVPEGGLKITLSDGNGKTVAELSPEGSLGGGELSFSTSDPRYSKAAFAEPSAATTYSGRSCRAMLVVDEPGEIRPKLSFTRKQGAEDWLLDRKRMRESEGVSADGAGSLDPESEESLYEAVESLPDKGAGGGGPEKDALTCTLSDPLDVLFFSYKYALDDGKPFSKRQIEEDCNKIEITVDDGTRMATQEYPLLDFLRTSAKRSTEENLVRYAARNPEERWDPDADSAPAGAAPSEAPAETAEASGSAVWGVKNGLFCQTLVAHAAGMASDEEDRGDGDWESWETSLYALAKYNVPETQFPYVRYAGTVSQGRVSAGLIAATTIVVVRDDGAMEKTAPGGRCVLERRYSYPTVEDDGREYRLHFRFEEGSEMRFVTTDDQTTLKETDSVYALTASEINNRGAGGRANFEQETNALHFTVGFKADDEGSYCNTMGVFARDVGSDEDHFLGAIRFLTDVVGEDERYRTLFANFGTPDPAEYPNVFRQKDPAEEGTDWLLVNEKSKELFVNRDEIFPFAGTYKALFNAVKFLGYEDVDFKEWYKVRDSNDKTRYAAVPAREKNGALAGALKRLGVEYGEFDRYAKLNRLSMVYHLTELDEEKEDEKRRTDGSVHTYCRFPDRTGNALDVLRENEDAGVWDSLERKTGADEAWKNVRIRIERLDGGKYAARIVSGKFRNLWQSEASGEDAWTELTSGYLSKRFRAGACVLEATTDDPADALEGTAKKTDPAAGSGRPDPAEEVPGIKKIYEYRSDEVLAKLYSAKAWLESHATGVNCYISDVDGESVVAERLRTEGHVTDHQFKDVRSEATLTPVARQATEFKDSSALAECTLGEFDGGGAARGGATFEDYGDYPIEAFCRNAERPDEISAGGKTVEVYESSPLCAMTTADELSYELRIENADSGSLYEFAADDSKSNPVLVNDGEITFWSQDWRKSAFDPKKLPSILIRNGNLRATDGEWSATTLSAANVLYAIRETVGPDGNAFVKVENVLTKKSVRCKGAAALVPGENASLEYTADNKWRLPMFIAKNYRLSNRWRPDAAAEELGQAVPNGFSLDEPDGGFVVEIIQGEMKFSNRKKESPKHCDGATLSFDVPASEARSGEQSITVGYEYFSDRTAPYEYAYESVKENYDDLPSLLADLEKAVSTNGAKVRIPTNRTGDYSVTVRGFDSYDNCYAARGKRTLSVTAARPEIEILVNSETAGSDEPLRGGAREPASARTGLGFSVDPRPKFPAWYKIFNAVHDSSGGVVRYDNVSYALDTPKAGDFLTLSNTTERAEIAAAGAGTLRLKMDPANPRKQNVFHPGGRDSLCVYDDELREILWESAEPLDVVAADPEAGTVELRGDLNGFEKFAAAANDGGSPVNLYVINATEIELDPEEIARIENDTSARTAFVPVRFAEGGNGYSPSDLLDDFPADTMAKLTASKKASDGTVDQISEAAYRVLDASVRTTVDPADPAKTKAECGYVLSGNADLRWVGSLSNRNVRTLEDASTGTYSFPDLTFRLAPLHSSAAEYRLRVDADALESVYSFKDYEYYAMETEFRYNQLPLLFGSYFDDSYAASVTPYDPKELAEAWNPDAEKDLEDASVFSYVGTPVAVDPGTTVVLRPAGNTPQLESGFKRLWKWSARLVDDCENWPGKSGNAEKAELFEAVNDALSVRPTRLGSQYVELDCADRYGNVLKNDGGGNIWVRRTDDDSEPPTLRNAAANA